MEEELNENELEERLYAMLHHVDETQTNLNTETDKEYALQLVDSVPRSTIRRYWRTSVDNPGSQYKKINTAKKTPVIDNVTNITNKTENTNIPKAEKPDSPPSPAPTVDFSIFQSPVPQNIKKTIEILDIDTENANQVVELQSSDEDEVIEVALPPKPTITIESSDDEVKEVSPSNQIETKTKVTNENKTPNTGEREVTASPVPSIVSSVSDDFIRGDCIALNISSKHLDNHKFDFTLHGTDFVDQTTPAKKKKKKKNKDRSTSTPKISEERQEIVDKADECFATPKSKAKNKKSKNKSNTATEKSILNSDVYDSDSNQSITELTKKQNPYLVTDKSLPSADVYESDSNQSETVTNSNKPAQVVQSPCINLETSIPQDNHSDKTLDPIKISNNKSKANDLNNTVINLTDDFVTLNETGFIEESIVMANVTGFKESDDYNDDISITNNNAPKFGSTKVPAILYEDLDFDNLKGKDKVCTKRQYSMTTLRAEMEKFYNESWGGENFNHREIQKSMSRDKSLWVIDPKDRMPTPSKKRHICNYCNRPGHRDDTCRLKPPVCYMCGNTGHFEPRCPRKICVNCGSPNYMYSTMCQNCSSWGRIICAECGQNGHPSSHCPDLWRRYHNTVDENMPLEENHSTKRYNQLYCSGCTRRGHLINSCRITLPFSGLPINSPYVAIYRPIYQTNTRNQDGTVSSYSVPKSDKHKRQSKSPTVHENHNFKRRNFGDIEESRNTKSPPAERQRKNSHTNKDINKNQRDLNKSISTTEDKTNADTFSEKALDFIPIDSSNHDKQGQVIQDNEVSDTSDIVTSARIYVTTDIIEKLKAREGEEWLKEIMRKYNVNVQYTDVNSFLSIKGKVGDQEAFQNELRNWMKGNTNTEHDKSDVAAETMKENESNFSVNIPKNRNNVLRKLNKAFDSLKHDIGDPIAIYKELTYLQNQHVQLLNKKEISPKQVSNNRDHINEALKKLNMVLIGQAGLADGSRHLNELYSLQERLTNFRQKNLSVELRSQIGEHYHRIFTATPRDDYNDLLKKYYVAKNPHSFFRKNKQKENARQFGTRAIKKNPIKQRNIEKDEKGSNEIVPVKKWQRQPLVGKTMNKVVYFHNRLMQARPVDNVLKKTRIELMRKLHLHIASLGTTGNLSRNTLKKIKKVQEQARLFLTNV